MPAGRQFFARIGRGHYMTKAYALDNDGIHDGLRVLVVEDEPLIGILLEDMITELGAVVVGPCASLADALAAAAVDNFDVALVDMNLRGEPADGVARLLVHRGMPFALVSGSPEGGIGLGETMTLQKPFSFSDIEAALQRLSSQRGQSRA